LTSKLPLSQGLVASTIALAVFTVLLPFVALWSDRVVGRKPLLLGSVVGFIVLAYPCFLLLQHATFLTFLLVALVGCVLLTLVDSVMSAVFCEQFPTHVRASGIGLPYAIASAVFGGTAPLVATWFIARHQPTGIAFYVMAICLVSGIIFAFMPETRCKELE
jgi:MHS family alpha-ketoglutarate permease-like MFS transporter